LGSSYKSSSNVKEIVISFGLKSSKKIAKDLENRWKKLEENNPKI
jgi:hypothetical protein